MPADEVMPEFAAGCLYSGSKAGPLVHSRAQAIAIAASEKDAADKGNTEYQNHPVHKMKRRKTREER